jgi:hypothetical protein
VAVTAQRAIAPQASVADRDRLQRRLEDGDGRIAEAQRAGWDVTAWEAFWLRLLREYEQLCRELEARQAPQEAST